MAGRSGPGCAGSARNGSRGLSWWRNRQVSWCHGLTRCRYHVVYASLYRPETTILLDPDLLDRLGRFAYRERTTKTSVLAAASRPTSHEHDTPAELGFVGVGRSGHGRLCSTPGRSSGARRSGAGPPAEVAILLDGSAVIAAADRDDLNHAAAVAWFPRAEEPPLLGALTLAQLDVLLQRDLGQAATVALVLAIDDGAIRLVPPTERDLARAAELMAEAAEHRPRLVDASSSRRPSASTCGAWLPSTGARSRSSGRATCGRSTSSRSAATPPQRRRTQPSDGRPVPGTRPP